MTAHHLPPRAELIRLRKTMSYTAIAEMYGVTSTTIANRIRSGDVKQKTYPTIAQLKANVKVPNTRDNQIYRMYFIDKVRRLEIAAIMGVSHQRITQILAYHPEYEDNKNFSNLPSDEILFDLYFVKLMSIGKICKQLKINNSRLSAALKRLPNYEKAKRLRRIKKLHQPYNGLPSTFELFRLYTEEGMNTIEIAKKFNVAQSNVYMHLSKHPQWDMVRKRGPNARK